MHFQGLKEKENQDPHEQQQHHNHNPWYSLLSCRLLSFIGGGNMPLADHEEIRNTVMPVISSHRLSAERRFSESSMHSIRCEQLWPRHSQPCRIFVTALAAFIIKSTEEHVLFSASAALSAQAQDRVVFQRKPHNLPL